MKAIMQSIQPKWYELIANSKKTVEVRKTRPKIETPFKVYMYCTGGRLLYENFPNGNKSREIKIADYRYNRQAHALNGKVIGEYICDSLDKYTAEFTKNNCYEDIRWHYLDTEGEEQEITVVTNKGESANCWFLNETCLSFQDIKQYIGVNFHEIPFYGYHLSDLVIYDEPKKLGNFMSAATGKPLTRPPQSWCYVEEIKSNE